MLLFDCNFKLALYYFVCGAISNTKKETNGNFFCETTVLLRQAQYIVHVLREAVSKKLNLLRETLLLEHAQVRCAFVGKSRVKEIQTSSDNRSQRQIIQLEIKPIESSIGVPILCVKVNHRRSSAPVAARLVSLVTDVETPGIYQSFFCALLTATRGRAKYGRKGSVGASL